MYIASVEQCFEVVGLESQFKLELEVSNAEGREYIRCRKEIFESRNVSHPNNLNSKICLLSMLNTHLTSAF